MLRPFNIAIDPDNRFIILHFDKTVFIFEVAGYSDKTYVIFFKSNIRNNVLEDNTKMLKSFEISRNINANDVKLMLENTYLKEFSILIGLYDSYLKEGLVSTIILPDYIPYLFRNLKILGSIFITKLNSIFTNRKYKLFLRTK